MSAAPYRKKLIEVALPLAEINAACSHEKKPGIGPHPRGLHLWWARRPLAACRAVLFASLVDDPSSDPEFADRSEAEQAVERERLFQIIRDMVPWENANNPEIIGRARAEIMRSTGGNPPPVLDPFCGGGSIPLEAQRLGLEAHASDLNPVAVLITKALIEIPPRFAGQAPVNPEDRRQLRTWSGAEGLAADVRHYGAWMRAEAERRIGHLYPKARLPKELGGGEATVIAWLWARTVTCPNPACGGTMPLASSFELSKKKGKETWVQPAPDRVRGRVDFTIGHGAGKAPTPPKQGRGARFACLLCGQTVPEPYIKSEGMAGRMGAQLMAIVAEGAKGRVYLPATSEHEAVAHSARTSWRPDQHLANDPRNIWCINYGLTTFGDLFTDRQLVALTTFSDLVGEARDRALADAIQAGLPDDERPLEEGGSGAQAYPDAVATYLGLVVSRMADFNNALCRWSPSNEKVMNLFSRQAIPMVWDFAEANAIGSGVGGWKTCMEFNAKCIETLPTQGACCSIVTRKDARTATKTSRNLVFSTDPPYYDNIGYADLSDFFYVWLRRSLGKFAPSIFLTMQTPKADELIASAYRERPVGVSAEMVFELGLAEVFKGLSASQEKSYPLTIFYAFKQREVADQKDNGGESHLSSPGWERMLTGLIDAGLSITATWPVRSEQAERMVADETNALASSIVLACRPRPVDADEITRRAFIAEARRELQDEIAVLLDANIAPVDLAQAVIGPGLAIFTRHSRVIESDGTPMTVRAALALINELLDEVLEAHDERLDADTRFCVGWYEQFGYAAGPFGQADVLARAKGAAVEGLQKAGVVEARQGKVRLLRRDELDPAWNPESDGRVPVWEALQHLVGRLEAGGVDAAGELLAQVGDEKGELSKQLAVRLYEVCDRRKWASDAYAYNIYAQEYPEIVRMMQEEGARYDNFVREYPAISQRAGEINRMRLEQRSYL